MRKFILLLTSCMFIFCSSKVFSAEIDHAKAEILLKNLQESIASEDFDAFLKLHYQGDKFSFWKRMMMKPAYWVIKSSKPQSKVFQIITIEEYIEKNPDHDLAKSNERIGAFYYESKTENSSTTISIPFGALDDQYYLLGL